MILIPTYSGVFDIDKRTCLVFFDGKMIPYVCNKFEPVCVINLTQKNILNKLDSHYKNKIINNDVDYSNVDLIINLINSLKEYNVIFYTEDLKKIDFFIEKNLYNFRMKNVGIGTCINQEWNISDWYNYVKQFEQN